MLMKTYERRHKRLWTCDDSFMQTNLSLHSCAAMSGEMDSQLGTADELDPFASQSLLAKANCGRVFGSSATS
jgi:hypothetical protein